MRYDFRVISFKQDLFIIGGSYDYNKLLNTCLKYDVKQNKQNNIAKINERRSKLSCTVFNGKIAISGGFDIGYQYNGFLKSVESYDHHKHKWILLADMEFKRIGHSAVSMSNKMFIIGSFNQRYSVLPCEVYGKISNKFSCIEPPGIDDMSISNVIEQPYCVGNKIVIITGWYENTTWFNVYDVDKNSWSGKNSCVNNQKTVSTFIRI